MHITFETIRFKNFLSVGNEFASFKLNEQDMTVIVGENGSGKSTIIDALLYVLYNKPLRKVNLGQLINTFNKKQLLVELVFSIGANRYVVRRGQKPKVFEIYKNKELIPEDSSGRDYQSMLEEEILGVNYKTFTQINILGKATYVPFMNLTAAHRREVVEDLLDSKIYSVMASLAKVKIKDLKPQVSELSFEIQSTESLITSTQAIIDAYNADKSSRVESTKQKIADLTEQKTDLQGKFDLGKEKLVEFERELDAVGFDLSKIVDARQKLLVNLETHKRQINIDQKFIDNINSLTTCDTCFQEVDESHKKNILDSKYKSLEDNQKEIPSLEDKISKLTAIKKNIDNINEKISTAIRGIENIEYKLRNIDEQISYHEVELTKLEKPAELGDVANIDDLNVKLKNLTERYDLVNKDIERYNRVVKLLADDGVKAKLLEQYIPAINHHINHYLEYMDLFAQFELDEEFNETIKSHYRDQFSYHSFSEGQKMRIDLAIMLTWRQIAKMRNSTSTNLLIMDEVMDGSLNADGVANFLSILKTMNISQNIFVISHKNETIDMFDNVIRASLNGNYTEYERL